VPRAWMQWAAGRSQASIGVSAALVDRMRSLGLPPERLHVMRNGVDMQRFQLQPQAQARQSLAITHAPVLLTVGNLHEHKGQRLALQALQLVRHQHPQAQLYVVGEGPDREALLHEAHALGVTSAVHLIGAVPNTRLSTWYSAADVLILASSREGWPNVLLEAMACGTPVAATRVGGVPEIVQNPQVGRVVEPRSAAAFAQAVIELLQQGQRAENPREAVRRYAQGFSWDRTSQDQLALFHALVGARARQLP
jgi:teichuronic acid biosynthesis glycosyltransferase TuaC